MFYTNFLSNFLRHLYLERMWRSSLLLLKNCDIVANLINMALSLLFGCSIVFEQLSLMLSMVYAMTQGTINIVFMKFFSWINSWFFEKDKILFRTTPVALKINLLKSSLMR